MTLAGVLLVLLLAAALGAAGALVALGVLNRRANRRLDAAVSAARNRLLLADRHGVVRAASRGALELPGIRVGEHVPDRLWAGSEPLATRTVDLGTARLYVLEDAPSAELARRAAAWAPVARDLGHGIKNPLTTIRLKVQQLARSSHPLREQDLQLVLAAVDRVTRLTDGFVRLAQLDPPCCEPSDLNELVRRVVARFAIFPERLALNLAPDLPPVPVDAAQVETALANLVSNAADAVAGSGTVAVATATRELIVEPGGPSTRFAVVEVADTGVGIPEQFQARLFRPGFSLKDEGDGLGLALARKIVEDHGGRVELHSREGVGTTARLWLPLR